jgi:D-alanyl-D-alanine dipeptidase
VVKSLIQAQDYLHQIKSNWRIKIFDAFRPLSIQKFMVDHTFQELLNQRNLDFFQLSSAQIDALWQEVYTIWAIPNHDPKMPPPHSTGAAIDITLVNETGKTINMGGEIDELSQRSLPNYYANAITFQEQIYHQNRALLYQVMKKAGFRRHLGEWWHFSLGDQMWVWLGLQECDEAVTTARYGRVEI